MSFGSTNNLSDFPIKKPTQNNPCSNCNSKNMKECLIKRHCPYWVVRK